jgi:hypothetical protein
MRSVLLLQFFVAGLSASAGGAELPAVTLHLQSADVRMVLSGLAASGNLEASISPEIIGNVSLDLDAVPFERALARIGAAAGLEVSVDHGRLVAARRKGPSETAPELPPEFRSAPRVPASEFSRALEETPPLFVTTGEGRERRCRAISFGGSGPEAVALGEAAPGALRLVELAWDPARRLRYLAVDGGTADRRQTVVFEGGSRSIEIGDRRIALSSSDPGGCDSVRGRAPIGVLDATEAPGPNAGAVLIRVAVDGDSEMVSGWCLAEGRGGASTHGATRSPWRGATRDWTLSSYVTDDGTTAALVLAASSVWTDPADGREYRTTQYAASGFLPLTREPVAALSLERGPANPGPVALTAVRERDWATCASRAAVRAGTVADR